MWGFMGTQGGSVCPHRILPVWISSLFVIPQGSVLCFCFNTNVIHITFRCFLKDLRQSGAVGTIYRSLMNYFQKIFFETQLGWLPPWISMWEHVGEDKFHQREVLTHFQV